MGYSLPIVNFLAGCSMWKLKKTLFICLFLYFLPQNAFAKEYLRILPAIPLTQNGDLIGIQYILPCNATYRSTIFHPEQKNSVLKTGVLVHFNNISCMKMSSTKKTFFQKSFKISKNHYSFSPFIPKYKKAKLSSLRIVEMNKSSSKRLGITRLQFAFRKSRKVSKNSFIAIDVFGSELEVAVLSFRKKKASKKSRKKLRRTSLKIIPSQKITLSKLDFNQNEVNFSYKIVPIKKYEIEQNNLHLTYSIPCDSAPVGVLINEKNKHLKVAMLTTRLPQKYLSYSNCSQSKKSTETFVIRKLDLDKYSISHLDKKFIKKHQKLYVQRPTKIRNKREAQAYYVANCSETLGLVYSKTQENQVSLGVLKDHNIQTCDKNLHLKKLTLNMMRTQYELKPLSLARKIII